MDSLQELDLESLLLEANDFAKIQSSHYEPKLYGVTDGKAVGTYLEHKFQDRLDDRYSYERGSSAKGIDFPDLNVDMKVTSYKQPQSSSPYVNGRQKVVGLGYSLLVFVYQKQDDEESQSSNLNILHTIFIDEKRTSDYQTTRGIREIIDSNGNEFDLVAFMNDRMLPLAESEALLLAEELLKNPPVIGFLTISNALQWRLQYSRAIDSADSVDGVVRVY